jgi:hypothetical protein
MESITSPQGVICTTLLRELKTILTQQKHTHPLTETPPVRLVHRKCDDETAYWRRKSMLENVSPHSACSFCHRELPLPARRTHRGNHVRKPHSCKANHVLLPSWRCCFLSKQGSHAHARKHTFPCGANFPFPKKRLCLSLWCHCFLTN